MALPPGLTPLPTSRAHNCFGCSPVNDHGLQMRFFTDDRAVYSRVMVPQHLCGWSQIVHGGVLFTILDEIMSWATMYLLKRITVTQSMQIEFLKPAIIGRELSARGGVVQTAGKHDVKAEGTLSGEDGDVYARAQADFKVFSPAVARRLGIADDTSLQWFAEAFEIR